MSYYNAYMGNIKCEGRVNRVDVRSMFIETTHGPVFCPFAIVNEPGRMPFPSCSDLREMFASGDIVHLTASRQPPRNGCEYIATKVRKVNNILRYVPGNNTPNAEPRKNEVIVLTNVTDSLAFAKSENVGEVFIPGAAFSDTRGTKLTTYLHVGDYVMADVRPQSSKNGCSWIAITATPMVPNTAPFSGTGRILELHPFQAVAMCSNIGRVECHVLTWVGGDDGGKATSLTDLLRVGDEVRLEAVFRDGRYSASRWVRAPCSLPAMQPIQIVHTNTQTAPSVADLLFRSIDEELLEHLGRRKPVLRNLVEQSKFDFN